MNKSRRETNNQYQPCQAYTTNLASVGSSVKPEISCNFVVGSQHESQIILWAVAMTYNAVSLFTKNGVWNNIDGNQESQCTNVCLVESLILREPIHCFYCCQIYIVSDHFGWHHLTQQFWDWVVLDEWHKTDGILNHDTNRLGIRMQMTLRHNCIFWMQAPRSLWATWWVLCKVKLTLKQELEKEQRIRT